MGLILDSSVVIAAERRAERVAPFLRELLAKTGDEDVALSSIGLTELAHGIHRAHTPEARKRREEFIGGLLAVVPVFPYTKETALLAGKVDGEAQQRGVVIPFADLLIGATALSLGYSVVTTNPRHFQRIPGLNVIQL